MQQGKDTDPARGRWAGAGHSSHADAARAGREAVGAAIARDEPRLVLVFASPRYDLVALAAAADAAAGPAELIGCSTAGEIGPDGLLAPGVVAFAIGGPGFSVATRAADSSGGAQLRAAGEEVAACVAEVADLPHKALILLTDGLAGDPQHVVRGAYSVAGAVLPLAGGCAGAASLDMGQTRQFRGAEVMTGAVVGAALASDAPLGIGVRHGWDTVGEPLLITASQGTVVHALNDSPALDVYLDRLRAPREARADPRAFTRFALGHPFGVASPRGRETQVRGVAYADFETRALHCIAEIPQGTLAWLMDGERDAVLDATAAACREALGPLGGRPPLGLLAFESVARAGVLGPEGEREAFGRITAAAGGAPVAGFRTEPGEIARTHGLAGFHNQSLVVVAFEAEPLAAGPRCVVQRAPAMDSQAQPTFSASPGAGRRATPFRVQPAKPAASGLAWRFYLGVRPNG